MQILTTPEQLRHWHTVQHRQGLRIGVVPTMGALHDGHLQLVDQIRPHVDRVVVTIFVNPLQFGPNEDFGRYPRQFPADCALCQARGVDAVYHPAVQGMYSVGFQTHIEVEQVSQRWCGASRPGHFRGVATVVLKLLNQTGADVAIFGEKDWQQLQVIRQMCRDLDHPAQIVGAPIVREPDGLAMSSRNVYLSAEQRHNALAISRGLKHLQQQVLSSTRAPAQLQAELIASLAASGGQPEYVALVHAQSLEPLGDFSVPGRALVAARYGATRLIDNVELAIRGSM